MFVDGATHDVDSYCKSFLYTSQLEQMLYIMCTNIEVGDSVDFFQHALSCPDLFCL